MHRTHPLAALKRSGEVGLNIESFQVKKVINVAKAV